jgi:hypothetical protein
MKGPVVIILLLTTLFLKSVFSQSNFDAIRNQSDRYIYGYAIGQGLRETDNAALVDLISQISLKLESEFVNIVTEKDGDITEFTHGIIKTFSNATLDNAERIVNNLSDGSIEVLRYIKRDDLAKIFIERQRKIIEYACDGYMAEKDLRLADAIKYYYWAFVLLRTHPDHNSMQANLDGTENRLLITTLPDRISKLLTGISIEITGNEYSELKKQRKVTALVSYQNCKIQNLELRYFTGSDWDGIVVRNGIFGMVWYGNYAKDMDKIRIGIEYRFDNQLVLDAEVKDVYDKTRVPLIPKTYFDINASLVPLSQQKEIDENENIAGQAVGVVLNAIESGDFNELKKISTARGFKDFNSLMVYGNVQPLPLHINLTYVKLNDITIIRSIPMQFNFHRNRVQFSEMVNIILNNKGQIDGFTFSIGDNAINDILSKSEAFGSNEEKYHLIHFMELYKTAYCTKDINFVKSVFADNALIIIGNILKSDKNIDNMYGTLGDKIEYIRLSKKEYIERLERVFRSNEFVNIQFDENSVRRATNKPDDKVYGIQIKQNYYSSNYADKGYLFLMIDLNDTLNPTVYVRTWQPEKNPDGSIFGVSDFRL